MHCGQPINVSSIIDQLMKPIAVALLIGIWKKMFFRFYHQIIMLDALMKCSIAHLFYKVLLYK